MQESSYESFTVYTQCGRSGITNDTERCVYQDFGMSQINYKTATKYNFDVSKLVSDDEYSINSGAEVLKWFHKTYAKKEPRWWWTRYNCGTKPKASQRSTCMAYFELVARYL